MHKRIVLRTHGGLGNQLFQICYAICFSRKNSCSEISVIHDSNYKHSFQLEDSFLKYCRTSMVEQFVSRFRIPKIFSRLGLSKSGSFVLGDAVYLDAYFQDEGFYRDFDASIFNYAIDRLKEDLALEFDDLMPRGGLLHIRLRDFFLTEEEEYLFAKEVIINLTERVDLITNNEKMIQRIIEEYPEKKALVKILPSSDLSAIDLLKLMGKYEVIKSNGSTLALWAALLFGRKYDVFGAVNRFSYLLCE